MKAKLVAILVMVGLVIALAACSTAQAASTNVPKYTPKPTQAEIQKVTQQTIEATIDEFSQSKNLSKSLELNNGDTLTLILGSNPTTGFSWQEQAQISDKAVLEQTDYKYLEPASKDGQPLMGASGKDVRTFKALKAGTSVVSLSYSQPWEGGQKAEWTFQLTVVVK